MATLAPIRYRIAPVDPRAHLFEARCTVADPHPDGQVFRLPTWIPGSYLIREFARSVVRVRAEDSHGDVAIEKTAKDTWRAAPATGALTITIEVYSFDLSVRTAYLDETRGFFNGTSVFLAPDGFADRPCEVEVVAPEGETFARWRVATALPHHEVADNGFGTYRAQSYDVLIDAPVEMSDYAFATFEAGGARHEIVISGRHEADLDRLAADLARVCATHCELFHGRGGRAPFERYVFLVAAVGDGYGGLEHRASTSLLCKRTELPAPGVKRVSEDYRNFLGLASHEYFHAWNVKRIKPAAFVPYDLGRENYTRQLWAFEGITSYYDDLGLVRSGVIDVASYLELLGRTISSVLRTPGRTVQSIAESSFDAWIKFYRADENTPNSVVSYYAKGAAVALALDLTLRRHASSLDALMRVLWERHGATGVGVPEGEIARIADSLAGTSLAEFFTRYVDGTEDPPFADLLADVGIEFGLRPSRGGGDRGGTPPKEGDPAERASFGASLAAGSEMRLQYVFRGGPAERAGLAAGDRLVAIDGLRATPDGFDKMIERRGAGETLDIHAFRRDELMTFRCTLEPAPRDACWLALRRDASEAQRAARAAWLGRDAGSEP